MLYDCGALPDTETRRLGAALAPRVEEREAFNARARDQQRGARVQICGARVGVKRQGIDVRGGCVSANLNGMGG